MTFNLTSLDLLKCTVFMANKQAFWNFSYLVTSGFLHPLLLPTFAPALPSSVPPLEISRVHDSAALILKDKLNDKRSVSDPSGTRKREPSYDHLEV